MFFNLFFNYNKKNPSTKKYTSPRNPPKKYIKKLNNLTVFSQEYFMNIFIWEPPQGEPKIKYIHKYILQKKIHK